MLEICPSIADGPISIKVNPLSMGDREDPARLVFTSKEGKGIATSLIDLGDRFRLIINTVDCKKNEKPMPKLPVATNFWTPEQELKPGFFAVVHIIQHSLMISLQNRWVTGQQ
jgi:L-arabinose isomerase